MKRGREDDQTLDLVNCLMLLSKVGQNDSTSSIKKKKAPDGVFVCKTCCREFSSFQALGGHRASHSKHKLSAVDDGADLAQSGPSSLAKPKAHECPICGIEFAIGQALGGHMRRHRDVLNSRSIAADQIREAAVPLLRRSSSSKRVPYMSLDLNLAPPGFQHYYDWTKLPMMS